MNQSDYRFRPVEAADLPALCSFPQSAQEQYFMFPRSTSPLTPEQLQAAIDARRESTVIVYAGSLAGFANFYVCQPGEKCAIGNVIVSPSLRGLGVGRALIGEMLRLAFEKYAAQVVEISCFNQNTAGLCLYNHLGFQPVSLEERTDWQGQNVITIHLSLSWAAWLAQAESQ
jgi:Acetyltransferases, including N-acetylases of ribosomal proteins